MTMLDTRDLETFRSRIDDLVRCHPVVTDNAYTRWFATGQATADQVRHLTVQFSVFSHLFVEAQLRKVINAADLDTYHAGKEILMNELGVVFNGGADADGVSSEGTVDGSRYSHRAAHFEWLVRFAGPLGPRVLRPRQAPSWHGVDPVLLRRAPAHLRVRGPVDRRGRLVRRRELGRRRVLEGADRRADRLQGAGVPVLEPRRSGPGTTGSRTSTRRTPPRSWARRSRCPSSIRTSSCAGAAEMLDGVKAFWDGLEADR